VTAAEALRSRTDLAAKSLGAIGSAGLTAVGLAKIGDLFPIPDDPGPRTAAVGAVIAFVLMGAAIAALTVALWRVNRPFFIGTDLSTSEDLSDAEVALIQPQWDDFTRLNGMSPARYERKANRHEKRAAKLDTAWTDHYAPRLKAAIDASLADQADRTRFPSSVPPSPIAQREQQRAESMRAEIHLLTARAGLRILRKRLSDVMSGRSSQIYAAIFLIGLIGFALDTDYVVSARKDRVEIAKSCADAAEAGATSLPSICKGNDVAKADQPQTPLTPAQHEAAAIEALAARYTACLKDAGHDPTTQDACRRLLALIPR
jgi:hypothetical protein